MKFNVPRAFRRKLILGGALYAVSLAANALPFNIQINFGSGLSATQQAFFTQAESIWESIITGYQPGISIGSVEIDASGPSIDGAGGILGQAGPDLITKQGGYWLASTGIMMFDSADLANMESSGSLLDVILHEMGHVLGFGTLWDWNGLYVNGSGQYMGANALSAYRREFNPAATYVPVELGGGSGTANGHWNELDGGAGDTGIVGLLPSEASYQRDFKYELMTGWMNSSQGQAAYISCTTKAAFIDLGYTVNACPEPGTLALFSLGVVGFLGRARKQPAVA